MVAGDRVHFSYGVRVPNYLAISLKTISFRSLSILLTAAELTHVHADTNAFHQSEFFFSLQNSFSFNEWRVSSDHGTRSASECDGNNDAQFQQETRNKSTISLK